jgi:wobble nucleotide-excising tRNase
MELRSKKRNNTTIRNTLRRILENYFTLLGGINLDTLYTNFKGEKKIICKALCSWIHDGSHNVFNDDHYVVLDDTSVERYIGVFKQIFKYSGQIAHYNMMMGKKLNELTKNLDKDNRETSQKTKINTISIKEGALFDLED